jgi:hypothetical protein
MSIAAAAKATPLDQPNVNVPVVDPRTGLFTMPEFLRQQRLRNYVVGMGRIIPCLCAGTNVLTLTPNGNAGEDGESPTIEKYVFGDAFLFWAANNSTGAVTGTVVPKTGVLSTIKVYKTNGAAQAGAGDVVQNSVYVAYYAPHLDSNAGGLVLK